jgi:hypothetical protein
MNAIVATGALRESGEPKVYIELFAIRRLGMLFIQGLLPSPVHQTFDRALKAMLRIWPPKQLEILRWPPTSMTSQELGGLWEGLLPAQLVQRT